MEIPIFFSRFSSCFVSACFLSIYFTDKKFAVCSSVNTVVEFYSEACEIQCDLHPNEHSERNCLYLVRCFEAEMAKIGQIFKKQSFTRMVKEIMLLMKVDLLI